MTLRHARLTDALFLLCLANDPAMKAARGDERTIGFAEHFCWLRRMLANPMCDFYVAEERGEPVGEIRIDRSGSVGTVGLVVAPEARHKGHGAQMIRQACQESPATLFVAQIAPENVGSWKAFERAGFRKAGVKGLAVYRKGDA